MSNQLLVSAAGSGKTTLLVNTALSKSDETVLLTTYTEENEREIKRKLIQKVGCIPGNIAVMTWFSFLLKNGVRPFQDAIADELHDEKIGFLLSNCKSGHRYGKVYWGEKDFFKHYFTKDFKIYSDKISKFILRTNKESGNQVIDRICRIYQNIMIDEVQDLAGYDLDIIHLLLKEMNPITLAGDPRQTIYLTHPTTKYGKYQNGQIAQFIQDVVNKRTVVCNIDTDTLCNSHRNHTEICSYSNRLYPDQPEANSCDCCSKDDVDMTGVVVIRNDDLEYYLGKYKPVQIRWNRKRKVNEEYSVYNFGESKGMTFNRTLIYPTSDMISWVLDNSKPLKDGVRAKFYVGLTRAKYSTAILYDYKDEEDISGLKKYMRE